MTIIKTEFLLALNQVATERGISPEDVLSSIEAAIVAAYKREYPKEMEEELIAKVSKETGETKILKNEKLPEPATSSAKINQVLKLPIDKVIEVKRNETAVVIIFTLLIILILVGIP